MDGNEAGDRDDSASGRAGCRGRDGREGIKSSALGCGERKPKKKVDAAGAVFRKENREFVLETSFLMGTKRPEERAGSGRGPSPG